MELDRVRRLLLAEYSELLDDRSAGQDSLLVESPFAETTRDGRGVREVALGLTRTKLIVAADVLPSRHEYYCPKYLDASIESLELLSVYPLELVTLSVYRRRRRRSLKARLVDGRTRYYELGGLLQLEARWALWCRHTRAHLERRRPGSSLSETTAAASSSRTSSIPRARPARRKAPRRCRGGAAGEEVARRGWAKKDLYLGAEYAELGDGSYAPQQSSFFAGASVERAKDELKDRYRNPSLVIDDCRAIAQLLNFQPAGSSGGRSSIVLDIADPESDLSITGSQTVSSSWSKSDIKRIDSSTIRIVQRLARFGLGVDENCTSSLCLGAYKRRVADPRRLADDAVVAWENGPLGCASNEKRPKRRHLRRYGISPSTYFLEACGPWSVQPGDRESFGKRRCHSCVMVRRQPAEPELRLPVSRRQLATSVSLGDLAAGICTAAAATRGRLVLFWTPDYWYRPRAATEAYRQVRRHLGGLWLFRMERERREMMAARGPGRRRHDAQMTNSRSGCILNRLLSGSHASSCSISQEAAQPPRSSAVAAANSNSTTALLRRLLRLEYRVSLWDLDSRTLACQLTLVDRELFARVPARELVSLARHRSSRDSPNLAAWVAFAHRVSCLVASEIIAVGKIEMRARLMARSINAAERCFEMGNFQSARSIVAGLQSPAVYRLRETWAYLKTRHATRYETIEKLCRVFRSVNIPIYCEAWARAEARAPPLMPFVGDVIARTLGLKNDDARQDGDEKQGQTLRMRGKLKLDRQKRLRRTSLESISPEQQAFKVADWLERCQRYARSYDYPGHALAWEFLLKARYLEDRENFLASLELEPPTS